MGDTMDMVRREVAEYGGGRERPVGSYARLVAVYAAMVALLTGVFRVRKGAFPDRLGAADLVLVAAATHKLSRLVANEPVTSPLRAPFTRVDGDGEELREESRGSGMQKAIGDLLTCPFCVSQWIGTALAFGVVLAPRPTRFLVSLLTALAASDFLQLAYSRAHKSAE